jgi:hypothetical protein
MVFINVISKMITCRPVDADSFYGQNSSPPYYNNCPILDAIWATSTEFNALLMTPKKWRVP